MHNLRGKKNDKLSSFEEIGEDLVAERLLVERLSEFIRMYDKHRSSLFEGLQICFVGRAFIHLQRITIIIGGKGERATYLLWYDLGKVKLLSENCETCWSWRLDDDLIFLRLRLFLHLNFESQFKGGTQKSHTLIQTLATRSVKCTIAGRK